MGRGSGFGGGDGDGEWSGVSGMVGIFSVNRGCLTCGGELDRSLESTENMLSISSLIANVSSWSFSSKSLTSLLVGGGWLILDGVKDEMQLVMT